jgi:hypothetical protein
VIVFTYLHINNFAFTEEGFTFLRPKNGGSVTVIKQV